jgi:hypothetical protein
VAKDKDPDAAKEKGPAKEKPAKEKPAKEKGPAKEKKPSSEAKPEAIEPAVSSKEWIQQAAVQELLQVVRQTALAVHPLVREFEKSAEPLKEQALRQLTYREQKNHADFRNRLASLLTRK